MCGIVGVVGSAKSVTQTLEGLKKLEYRGYDSAGICTITNNDFTIIKEKGKIQNLKNSINQNNVNSNIAIGHTRWATHGIPNQVNAHPHRSNNFAVVHNGIVENYQELKKKLNRKKSIFLSDTDTEVIPHLIEYYFNKEQNIRKALIRSCQDIIGTYAIAVLDKNQPDTIYIAKKGSPLILGVTDNIKFISSDYLAFGQYCNKIITFEDNDFAEITPDKISIFDINNNNISRKIKTSNFDNNSISKDGYDHFMLKEIYEQPRVIEETLQTYINPINNTINLTNYSFKISNINSITIIACGTSYYAGYIAKYLIEELAQIKVNIEIASEYRYSKIIKDNKNLAIFISQSGETADTLAALKYAKQNKLKTLSFVNVAHSSIAKISDSVIRTLAGPEIGVASTKAYSAQIAALYLFALDFSFKKNKINNTQLSNLIDNIFECGIRMQNILENDTLKNIKLIAKKLSKSSNALFIGRGLSYINSLEASLKLREISYINSHGIAAGELKHGTIALIDKKLPVIVIAPRNPNNELFEKTFSNASEVNARKGNIIAISDNIGLKKFKNITSKTIEIPTINNSIEEILLPIIYLQLLSYYCALYRGNDIDQPRNLAKSVTVE
jgi:glutamine---fructose-6-phosphate transaminase (isomerizing)|tara:strand:+ start:14786 stop:16627 length:1842 start_codon:yes stop_codon:yes gene_type:complete